jgi:hypothetical protein
MKTTFLLPRLLLAALTAAALLLTLSDTAQAQSTPAGDWDVVFGGSRRGTAQLTFNPDFTLFGNQIVVPAPVKNSAIDDRTGVPPGGSADPRTGNGGTNSSSTNLWGTAFFQGSWSFDQYGRVIGFYVEIAQIPEGTTNRSSTNAVSFVARVRTGRSITIAAQSAAEKFSLGGVSVIPRANLAGSYYGTGLRNGIPFVEFFSMAPTAFLNKYFVYGYGPGYTFGYDPSGFENVAMLSRQGQLGFFTAKDGTNLVMSLSGPIKANASSVRGQLRGQESTGALITRYNINRISQ